uniref:corticotropin-releasing factor receptor 2-like n=1 Tax=Myxine glutinosa TaxID=7769 RepID=UPI00358DE6AA
MRSGCKHGTMLLVQILAVVQGHSLASESLLCEAESLFNSTGVSCNATRDSIGTCWPYSPAGTLVLLPCPESFNGLRYDSSKSVFRECLANGLWAQRSNYSLCLPIIESKVSMLLMGCVCQGNYHTHSPPH